MTKLNNYINIDIRPEVKPDLVYDIRKELPFKNNEVDEIYTSHFIEHLFPKEFEEVLRDWRRILKPRGALNIRCPNGMFHVLKWVNATDEQKYLNPDIWINIVGSLSKEAGRHYNLFTVGLLKRYLEIAGFIIVSCKEITARNGKPKSDIQCEATQP